MWRGSGGKNGAFFPFGLPSVCTIDFLRRYPPLTMQDIALGAAEYSGGGGDIRVFSSPLSKVDDDLDKNCVDFPIPKSPTRRVNEPQPSLIRLELHQPAPSVSDTHPTCTKKKGKIGNKPTDSSSSYTKSCTHTRYTAPDPRDRETRSRCSRRTNIPSSARRAPRTRVAAPGLLPLRAVGLLSAAGLWRLAVCWLPRRGLWRLGGVWRRLVWRLRGGLFVGFRGR